MHAERSDCSDFLPLIETEKTVMIVLLSEEFGGVAHRADLQREIAGTRGRPQAVIDALGALYAAGLVHFTGELVTSTRPAQKMWELSEGGM